MPSKDAGTRQRHARRAAYARWAAQPASRTANAARRKAYAAKHPDRIKAYEKAYRERHKDRLSHSQRLIRYGLTPIAFAALLEQQDAKCAICAQKKKLHVDHNHTTGKVRGLLCGNCNHGIGQLNDDASLLRLAIRYLEKDQSIAL